MFCRRNELVNIDERKQKAALKEFYDNEALKQKNERRIQSLKTFSKIVNPMFCIAFVIVFGLLVCTNLSKQFNLCCKANLPWKV